jgi:hypothetical protein
MREGLTPEEKELLSICLMKHSPRLVKELDKLVIGNIDKGTVNEMRSAVGDELVQEGLNQDDEPNEYGF